MREEKIGKYQLLQTCALQGSDRVDNDECSDYL